jgi:chromosome segregation ATPase
MNSNHKRTRLSDPDDEFESPSRALTPSPPCLGPSFTSGFQALQDKYDNLSKEKDNLDRDLDYARAKIIQQKTELLIENRRVARLQVEKFANDNEEKTEINRLRAWLTKHERTIADRAKNIARLDASIANLNVENERVAGQQDETITMLKTSLNAEKAKVTEKDNLITQLNVDLDAERITVAQQEAATVEHEKEKTLKDKVIAGLEAKIALAELNAQKENTITNYEKAIKFHEKINVGLEARLVLAAPKPWF